MFLTRFEINPARRGARRLLGSAQAMHAAVLAGFPRSAVPERVLWRLDRGEAGTFLYVVSPRQPDFTHLAEQAGWPTTAAWITRPYDALLSSLRENQRWAFRLTANPTRSVRVQEGRRGQRVGHVTVAQQLDWFLRRTERWGFALEESTVDGAAHPSVAVVARDLLSFDRREPGTAGAPRRVTIARATYEGLLRVNDPAALRSVLMEGAGPAKAYGCGLLTLAPLGPS
ncbi:type I-E CRISPR-associated protein Cas6/Cse3/CasE [Georgenia sp. TF02-10]|uniref:type I-E CRISPR-associated protein Cas6/Cse3/CasE n=1 Tax=Georgenia sp. TF02-10 TaxID=2917725 RepID=UPI001FA71334|nr:type I-E CRISPR-associated protein Cas6/Cse3/CasE [Georgenia sp. TF02-10]UNX54049.1 type I-E CRISPR-associated protein Cas6/Cse3/CasE [Georgenia sp. TF02-10]